MRSRHFALALLTTLPFASIACSDSVSDPLLDGEGVEAPVGISLVTEAAPPLHSAPSAPRFEEGELRIEGQDGELQITSLQFVIREIEAELDDDECEDQSDDCPEFLGQPRVVNLPLGEAEVELALGRIPAGRYDEFELEIDGWDDDDDPALLLDGSSVTGWPENAAIRVEGRFVPNNGDDARSFLAWLETDVEVELEFEPLLQVGADGASIELTVTPAAWFLTEDGQVIDLSASDEEFEIDDDLAEAALSVRIVS